MAGEEVMSNRKAFWIFIFKWVVVPGLAIFLGIGPALAQSSSANYTFLVGAGLLCDSGDFSACPAVVKSANGDSYEMSGAGALTTQSKPVAAAGTFTHKSTDGVVLETGVWIASELVSFGSYGIAPGALPREGRASGPPQFGPMHSRMFPSSVPAGGLAVLRVRLVPVWGLAKNATVEVNCALGKVPPERSVEGIRLALEKGGVPFDQEISGRAMFLLTRPGATAAVKAPAPEAETNPTPIEIQQ
jgi:hypothetical protein